jgi:hypothetical protein
MKKWFVITSMLAAQQWSMSQDYTSLNYRMEDPGCIYYRHDSVLIHDFAKRPDGYWLFEPASPRPDSAQVVFFVHGYSANNPAVYGQWIRHLVRQGNIVVFPRYQKNSLSPGPQQFVPNVVSAIKNSIMELQSGDHVWPVVRPFFLIGHSFGGAIIADLSVNWQAYDLPHPDGMLLATPGTGPFRRFPLDDYAGMPTDAKLLVIVAKGDRTVGDGFGKLVFSTSVKTPSRNLVRQYADQNGKLKLSQGHNECYALDTAFDSGSHGYSFLRAKRAKLDALDLNVYWKLGDALLDCVRQGENCQVAFGNTSEQRSVGYWPDGTPIRPLEVIVPEKTAQPVDSDLVNLPNRQ